VSTDCAPAYPRVLGEGPLMPSRVVLRSSLVCWTRMVVDRLSTNHAESSA
jgi:hypothetical protein